MEIDNRTERVWIKPQQENTFTFNMEAEPGFVHFDYQNVWIKEVKFEKNWSEWLRQLQHSRDPVAQRQAMIQLVKIAKEDSKPDLRARVAEALRTVIVGNYYFRIRTRAMVELQNLFASQTQMIRFCLTDRPLRF